MLSDPSSMAERRRLPTRVARGFESGLLIFALRREVMIAQFLRIRSEIASEHIEASVRGHSRQVKRLASPAPRRRYSPPHQDSSPSSVGRSFRRRRSSCRSPRSSTPSSVESALGIGRANWNQVHQAYAEAPHRPRASGCARLQPVHSRPAPLSRAKFGSALAAVLRNTRT